MPGRPVTIPACAVHREPDTDYCPAHGRLVEGVVENHPRISDGERVLHIAYHAAIDRRSRGDAQYYLHLGPGAIRGTGIRTGDRMKDIEYRSETEYGLYKITPDPVGKGEIVKLILTDNDQVGLEAQRDANNVAALAAGHRLSEERWAVRSL